MKNFKRMLFVAITVVLMSATASAGGFRWGIKAGMALNSVHFDKEQILNDVKDTNNRAGFTGGLTCEFTIPVINLGLDASLMYMHRSDIVGKEDISRNYFELPINLKYKLALPLVEKVVIPYIFTGPSFAVLAGKTEITESFKNKRFDISWNIGLGVELFKHLQVGASYGFGIGNTMKYINKISDGALDGIENKPIEGKNKYWTITAAWLF